MHEHQQPVRNLTVAQAARIKHILTHYITNNTSVNENNRTINSLVAPALRLAFHDCVGVKCDGCINLNNAGNAGLETVINRLDELYAQHNLSTVISRADFWVLASIAGVEVAARKSKLCSPAPCTQPNIQFRWGRKDCATAPATNDTHQFPDAHGDLNHVLTFFGDSFNMTTRDVVACLGAHTLGKAKRSNSGFEGLWVPQEDEFDNHYYTAMVNLAFSQRNVDLPGTNSTGHWQWNNPNRDFMMFNADMCLLRNITPEANGQVLSCAANANACGRASTADIVEEYAMSNERWVRDFEKCFQKMISHGYENGTADELKELVADDSENTTPSTTTKSSTSSGSLISEMCYKCLCFLFFIAYCLVPHH
ncbi:putative ascorbate peroxidase [Lingula anatina]|uniref:Ascorbate peroxidase n=1 Tax=Lingula anatina TaxID=7574 RepID=A0A1S3J028_LINAN|nr:putative ascorbate peroxidase [Lingula anatina]|eukprot:XP_013403613.1 putative ascorbate peroxidase [Lingula anatina]